MRRSIAIIGCQDGDEGKGKIVDYLISRAAERVEMSFRFSSSLEKPILVRRFQGGSNAGHTLTINGTVYKLHQIPSGIITPETYNLVGKGMYLDPRKLRQEILHLQAQEIEVSPRNVGIAANAQVTLQYHIDDDQSAFRKKKHTSTGSGIKQTAVDKYGRVGLRFIEFLDPNLMTEILEQKRFPHGMPKRYHTTITELVDSYAPEREILQQFVTQEHRALREHGSAFLFDEGANGLGLDVDDGLYPGITSSHPAHVPIKTETVVGVLKLYKSSVGTGDRPFVTQMPADLETTLRESWGERGTTTGKNRDLGYFDAVHARYALEVAGVDRIAGTCGDRMEDFARQGVKPKIAVAYEIDGKRYEEWHPSFFRRDTLNKAEPVYEEFAPWEKFTEADGYTLTPNAQKYVRRIEELLGKEFSLLGTGAERKEMIAYTDLLI